MAAATKTPTAAQRLTALEDGMAAILAAVSGGVAPQEDDAPQRKTSRGTKVPAKVTKPKVLDVDALHAAEEDDRWTVDGFTVYVSNFTNKGSLTPKTPRVFVKVEGSSFPLKSHGADAFAALMACSDEVSEAFDRLTKLRPAA